MLMNSPAAPKIWEKITAVAFGVVFVCVLLAVAIFISNPTPFQIFVFRVVLALAAGGLGAVIPGLIQVKGPFVRAGGAIALFVIVFWFNPPQLLATKPPQEESLTVDIPKQATLKAAIITIAGIDHSAPRFQPSCSEALLQGMVREGTLRARNAEVLISQLGYDLQDPKGSTEIHAKKTDDGLYEITCASGKE